jgi:hypothetical protein
MDSNLLKEAIADAKAVRQTALANAKVALEEAFSERYQAMFAEKLKEDAEMGSNSNGEPEMKSQENVSDQEIDELIKELESEVGEEPHAEPDGDNAPMDGAPGAPVAQPQFGAPAAPSPFGAPGSVPPPMPTAPGVPPGAPMGGEVPPQFGAPAPFGTQPQFGAPAPMGGEVPPQFGAPGEAPGAPAAPMGGEVPQSTPPSDVPPVSGEEETDEDVDLNELLESLKDEVEGDEKEKEDKLDEQKKLSSSAIGGKAGGSDNKKPSASANSTSKLETGGIKQEGMPSPEGTKVGPEDATKATRPNQAKNATSSNLSTPSFGGTSGPLLKATRPNSKGEFENTVALQENQSLHKQLNEAEDVIRYVKGQLNEVNLLNAKLLYTNKLFKEYNMNNTHKMRIVEMFDLAKNVREVKLTYANIAESLNFGGSEMKKKVVATTNSTVRSITEGLSSQPVGSTKPKEIISEGKFASRMKQLAGIRSEQKK